MLKTLINCCLCICSCSPAFPAFLHVDNVAKISVAVEVEDPEEVYQEEQQEFEVADPAEEQAIEANFANSES